MKRKRNTEQHSEGGKGMQEINAEGHIESLLALGFSKEHNRRYQKEHAKSRWIERDSVMYHLNRLDDAGIAGSVQNNALMFIKNAGEQKVWECFSKQGFTSMAKEILGGKSFSEFLTV